MIDERYSEYIEDLREVSTVKDEYFPDFLKEFLVNEYEDDNYYERAMAVSPLMQEVKQIRRKYVDFFDFQDAMDIYEHYMKLLAEKYNYPSAKAVMKVAKNGIFDDYIPPKPRLKNSRRNRNMATSGMIPSRKVNEGLSGEALKEIARKIDPYSDGSHITEDEIESKPAKRIMKVWEEASDRVSGIKRRQDMYRRNNNSEIDFILNFIQDTNRGNFTRRDIDRGEDRPLSEIVKDMKLEEEIPEALWDDYFGANTNILSNGRMISAEKQRTNEIMKMLYESGLDVFGTYGKNMSKDSVKMLQNAIGVSGPLTKKQRKELKKRQRQEQERMARRRENDALIERTLLRHRYDFKNGSSMTLSDLFPSDKSR